MKAFKPPHIMELHANGISDGDTIGFMEDTLAVYRSLYQGMAPIGEWIQTRVSRIIRGWLPGWTTSHGQIADESTPQIQSRSWDIIIHKPVPKSRGYPPPASPDGPYPLVPRDLCCAVVDTKGRYETPGIYSKAVAFDLLNQCKIRQLDFLGPQIVPILFIVASRSTAEAIEAKGAECGIPTFVMARAIDRKQGAWTEPVHWHLNSDGAGTLPMSRFREKLLWAAKRWTVANPSL